MAKTRDAATALNPRPGMPRRAAFVLACAVACSMAAGNAWSTIVSIGDVLPRPVIEGDPPFFSIVNGRLAIGDSAFGRVTVNGSSDLLVDRLWLGGQRRGVGELLIEGAWSRVDVGWPGRNTLDIGGSGSGTVTVRDGASLFYDDRAWFGAPTPVSPDCHRNCMTVIGNGAGSTGSLRVIGGINPGTPQFIASQFSAAGHLVVGNGSVFSPTTDGVPDYGTPGGSTQASLLVDGGGRVITGTMSVAQRGSGLARTGSEQVNAHVVVQGNASQLLLLDQAPRTTDVALLAIGSGRGSTGLVEVLDGGSLLIGASGPTHLGGINIGNLEAGSRGTLRVDGSRSQLSVSGTDTTGFLNIGNAAGAQGDVLISGGARIDSFPNAALPFASVGRRGGQGSLTVSGTDAAGSASTLRLNGRDPQSGAGAFLHIGRFENGLASTGEVSVLAGGRIEIDTSTLSLGNAAGLPGAFVGIGEGSTGSLTVSGGDTLARLRSTLSITGGPGMANYVGVGRDGANGTVTLSQGGRFLLDSSHVSSSLGTYTPGDAMFFEIGRRSDGGTSRSTGTMTITGAGSELALTGAVDRIISVGRGVNARGTLNILNSGQASALALRVGDGYTTSGSLPAEGRLNLNDSLLFLGGGFNGGPAAGTGASLSLGRNGGFGDAAIGNRSMLTIASTAPQASWHLGGDGSGPGGMGTARVSGGSVVTLLGDDAQLRIGSAGTLGGTGIGRLDIDGPGSRVSASGAGARVLVGAGAHTVGTAVVGSGAELSAAALIGVAHDGTADSGGSGNLLVGGTVSAPRIVIGSAGLLGGSGTVIGDVENRGLVSPGNSPGRLVIDGGFDSRDGTIELEVERQPDGSWRFDELVFGDANRVFLDGSELAFVFLGETSPEDFQAAGLFTLGSFFHEIDPSGDVFSIGHRHDDWFDTVRFSARSNAYRFERFSFSAIGGALFEVTAVPLPTTLPLVALAMTLLALATGRHRRDPIRPPAPT